MGLKNDIQELKMRSENEYQDYKNKVGIMMKEYDDKSSQFNVLIGTINAERLGLRKEIGVLYDFLQLIGGSLKEQNRISVFDFMDELPAPNQVYTEISSLSEPEFRDEDFLRDGIFALADHVVNKKLYEQYIVAVETKSSDYDKDISDRTTQILYMKDAIEIAKIYRNIVVTVRDTISQKILPELNLIEAFLYADAIREMILDGEKPDNVEICGISEYKGTKQDIHYQFVKNTFDFYKVSTMFFTQTVLADILTDRVITEEEKSAFNNQIAEIKQQIVNIENKKVM